MVTRGQFAGRVTGADAVRFTAVASLFAIFLDAALAHGLLWENDPYWTYWVTKTFLLATVIGLGTAWFGIGAGRGAAIIGVHTLVLTVYYWTLSPVGLPSSPEWLDFEHTWATGLPVHFAVLYLGYLSALWLWRRRANALAGQEMLDSSGLATQSLIAGVLLVAIAGAISSAALQEFPGATWFVVRILITVPLLMFWWSWAGRDALAAAGGAVFIALAWAAYGHFLGPQGLPDTPLRIFSTEAPSATVRWLDYKELWLISLPIYLVVNALILLMFTPRARGTRRAARAMSPEAVLAVVLLATGATIDPLDRGTTARLSASGAMQVAEGFVTAYSEGTGTIGIVATDMGARVTPLPPHDRIRIEASFESGGREIEVVATRPIVSDPLGRHTTWWGVGFDVEHHGRSGIGTSALPAIRSELAAFALGEVRVGGTAVASDVPVHVMTAESGLPGRLALFVGEPEHPVAGLPGGGLRAVWRDYSGEVPMTAETWRYAGGSAVVVLLLLALLLLNRREAARAAPAA